MMSFTDWCSQLKCTLDNMGKDKSTFQAATDVTAEVFGLCSTMPVSYEHFHMQEERKYRCNFCTSRFESGRKGDFATHHVWALPAVL